VNNILDNLGPVLAMALGAFGSASGAGVAGMAAAGAWKKCYLQNRPAPFLLIPMVAAPLTQTIYGFIVMRQLRTVSLDPLTTLAYGLFGGAALGLSAFYQGKAAAACCDAQAETGKGFSNYMIVLGLVETVAVFTMVFLLASMA
jgi:V/A-type H+-transporting ATPase subunit K